MVSRSGASLGTHTVRALTRPARLDGHADADGQPVAVRRADWPTPRAVSRVQDCWRIDDEWWREQPISRLYFFLLLDPDTLITVYHDLVSDIWFEQRG